VLLREVIHLFLLLSEVGVLRILQYEVERQQFKTPVRRVPHCQLCGDSAKEVDDCLGKLSNRLSIDHGQESQDVTPPIGQ